MSWYDQLQKASFRGVPFHVRGSVAAFGRNLAIHEYPYKDKIWAEDMGKGTRRIRIIGFLIGDDVIEQREKLIAAAETAGKGTLVHPTFGEMEVSIDAGGLTVEECWNKGRFFGFTITGIEGGDRQFPKRVVNTGIDVAKAADAADQSSFMSFVESAEENLKYGATVVQEVANEASMWAQKAQRLVNDATNMKNMVSTLGGSYGRYFGGRNRGFASITNGISGISGSLNQFIGQGATARDHVKNANNNLWSIGQNLGL